MQDTPESSAETASPFEQVLTYRLARVQSKLNAQAVRILRDVAGISLVQWRIITMLGRLGESSSSRLVKESMLDKGLLSRKLGSLISEGLIVSRPHSSDKRVQLLSLTPRGTELHDRTLPHMSARQTVLTKDFDASELDALFQALAKLEQAADIESEP